MSIKPPTNLLYANTVTRHSTSAPLARKRSVRARVASDIVKVGIFDISARAGLLFSLLTLISRRQPTFTFYPVEAVVPMGLGTFSEDYMIELSEANSGRNFKDLRDNIDIGQFEKLLEDTREQVKVDLIAGLFEPMLAFIEDDELHMNYYSSPVGQNVAISVRDLRDYAASAGRPFEAAVAMVTLAQIWSMLYDIPFHDATRGCLFDFCENRNDLVSGIRNLELCAETLAAIPGNAHDSIHKCLQAIREYQR